MRSVYKYLQLGLLAGGLLLTGCGGSAETATATPVAATLPPTVAIIATPTPVPIATPSSVAEPVNPVPGDAEKPGPDKAIAAARAALATRLGVDPAGLTVARIAPMEWPNAALGCAQPGKAYAEVVTPGYIVELAQGDTHYIYHVGATGGVATCAEATP